MADDTNPEQGGEDFQVPPAFFPREEAEYDQSERNDLVEVQVEGVFAVQADEEDQVLYVLLSDGGRRLTISIGPFEAQAISLPLDRETPDRPMTHDLMKAMMTRFGITIEKVIIDDLWSGTFYAKLLLRNGNDVAELDSRPSDAIALAVRFEAPIYVAESILEAVQS